MTAVRRPSVCASVVPKLCAASSTSVPLFLRCVWERAESRRCLLDFFMALDGHVDCLDPRWRDALSSDGGADEWCAAKFTPAQTREATVEAAARRLLRPQWPQRDGGPTFARALETLAANVSDVHAFKAPSVLERHAYRGGEARP